MDILLTALLAVLALCLTVVAAIAETAFTYLPHNEAEEAVEAHPDTLGARVLQRTLDGDSEAYTHPLRLTRLIAAAAAVLATMSSRSASSCRNSGMTWTKRAASSSM